MYGDAGNLEYLAAEVFRKTTVAVRLPPHKDNIKELKFRASKAEVCAMIGTYFCFCQFIYSSMIVSDIFSKDIERGMFNPIYRLWNKQKKDTIIGVGRN